MSHGDRQRQSREGRQRPAWRYVRSVSSLGSVRAAFGLPEEKEPSILQGVADKLAECAICFEPLCSQPAATLWAGDSRSCRHLFHHECANACPERMGCPLCRSSFSNVRRVPALTSPVEWFEAMDYNRDGRLNQQEVLYAVMATMPVDYEALEAILPALWASWGAGESESLPYAQLLGPSGLLRHVQETLQTLPSPETHTPVEKPDAPEAPKLDYDKVGWFEHWDTDGNGVLVREEVVRGLAKSFHSDVPAEVCSKRLRMRCVVEQLWPLVDKDGNDRITLNEFCEDGGLADCILQRFRALGSGSPRRERPRRPRRARSQTATLVSTTWSTLPTDLSDDGRNDRPRLHHRRSLGFRRLDDSDQNRGRKVSLQFSAAEANLNRLAKPCPRKKRVDWENNMEDVRDFTDCSDSENSDVDSARDDLGATLRESPASPTSPVSIGIGALSFEESPAPLSYPVSIGIGALSFEKNCSHAEPQVGKLEDTCNRKPQKEHEERVQHEQQEELSWPSRGLAAGAVSNGMPMSRGRASSTQRGDDGDAELARSTRRTTSSLSPWRCCETDARSAQRQRVESDCGEVFSPTAKAQRSASHKPSPSPVQQRRNENRSNSAHGAGRPPVPRSSRETRLPSRQHAAEYSGKRSRVRTPVRGGESPWVTDPF
eukprot:TRINITY_DN11474_c1_g3_i1.p1 TRINITY_DN11474_c1_g3~~TRINITY_DN11474_c1_g3_i1.p1  ORF type:complete len:658 (-),score=70.68 TRINITY_DN11474_c1_g3_i1:261-2234(-)